MSFVREDIIREAVSTYQSAQPFNHVVIDDFLKPNVLEEVNSEFLSYDSPKWFHYKNAIEDKKALNDWNVFPGATYRLFSYFNSKAFLDLLEPFVGKKLYADQGLHGGGWHIHGTGGNLNPHLDYSMHPKLALQRKMNLIVYVSPDFEESYGGHLGLWTHDEVTGAPGVLVKEVQPKQNRAVLFDTTQNSWHGLSRPLVQPEGIFRRSLAIYFLCDPPENVDQRGRALFAPRDAQKGDHDVEELIKLRSNVKTSVDVYRKN